MLLETNLFKGPQYKSVAVFYTFLPFFSFILDGLLVTSIGGGSTIVFPSLLSAWITLCFMLCR